MEEFASPSGRLCDLFERLEAVPDAAARELVGEFVGVLLELHVEGLARIVRAAAESGAQGAAVRRLFAEDDVVASLLRAHDLHPPEPRADGWTPDMDAPS